MRTLEWLGARGLGALKLSVRTLERLGAVKLGLRTLERLGAE
ncbi:MAG: hypothetical protein ABIK89_08505 [Planctomycetota bacterium]